MKEDCSEQPRAVLAASGEGTLGRLSGRAVYPVWTLASADRSPEVRARPNYCKQLPRSPWVAPRGQQCVKVKRNDQLILEDSEPDALPRPHDLPAEGAQAHRPGSRVRGPTPVRPGCADDRSREAGGGLLSSHMDTTASRQASNAGSPEDMVGMDAPQPATERSAAWRKRPLRCDGKGTSAPLDAPGRRITVSPPRRGIGDYGDRHFVNHWMFLSCVPGYLRSTSHRENTASPGPPVV